MKANKNCHGSTDITNFFRYYKEWCSTFDNLILTLQRQISTTILMNDNYNELLQLKRISVKTCVMSIINNTWMPQALTSVMWIGGIRPSDILTLILNHVELYTNQSEKINLLKKTTTKDENNISNKVDLLKQNISQTFVGHSFVYKGDDPASSKYHNQMFE
ncbi:transcription factor TGA2.1-like [Rutidosis leptorrhynchoides]|uniref:transcription factor TGA2.1-like n=1 Tax=Rutidosis leptorrhynchoides TaxID=125765 RepID=UPI003A994BDB